MKRVAIYNLYWHTYGGGEQVSGAFADYLAQSCEVTLLGPVRPDVTSSLARLGVDLSGCQFLEVMNDDEASEASAGFDLFVNGTYRSNAVNRAERGIYYVHFPEPPLSPRARLRSIVARLGSRVVDNFVEDSDGDGTMQRVKRGLNRRRRDLSWVGSYNHFAANSSFTADWVKRLWKTESTIVYPAVRPVVTDVVESAKKPLIASVGRFFDPALGHCKKQAEMLSAFAAMNDAGRAVVNGDQWRLALVGGADAASRDYTLGVRRAAQGLPVEVFVNKPRVVVEDTLAAASIYWHGTGFGENGVRHPERFEHFGIAVVEAMLAGCVPVVFGEAGPAEIVQHGVNGFHWHTLEELTEFTGLLMSDSVKRRLMAEAAVTRGREFSLDRFRENVAALVS